MANKLDELIYGQLTKELIVNVASIAIFHVFAITFAFYILSNLYSSMNPRYTLNLQVRNPTNVISATPSLLRVTA